MIESVTCPIDGCTRTTPRGKLLCKLHWRLVPKDVQQEVHRAWAEFVGERLDRVRRTMFRQGYILARGRAIQAVNALLSPNRPRSEVQVA